MQSIDDIKWLIADNQPEKAVDALLAAVKGVDTALLNKLILLKSQLKDFAMREHLSLAESNAEKQKIVNGLLHVADEVATAVGLSAASKSKAPAEEGIFLKGQQDVIALMWTNYLAIINKDINLYGWTLHEGNPNVQAALQSVQQLLMQDLSYEIRSIEVIQYDFQEARVKLTVATRAKSPNPYFKDNVTVSMNYLRRNPHGIWKIWSSEILEFKDINA